VILSTELEDDIISNSGGNRSWVENETAIADEDKVIGSRCEASSGNDESSGLDELHFWLISNQKEM